MNANELRIGNHIKLYHDECIVTTVGRWLHTTTTVDEVPIDVIQPIPLSEEWLIKFGFEPNGVYQSLRLPIEKLRKHGPRSFLVVDIKPTKEAWIDIISRDVHDQYTESQSVAFPCAHVHQLQNLYFALTGEELPIKQPVTA
jgi:hypothetical protein